jgi:hypothetical protein
MLNIEHLFENGLEEFKKENTTYDKWKEKMENDPNWLGVHISIEELWAICQYVYCGKESND